MTPVSGLRQLPSCLPSVELLRVAPDGVTMARVTPREPSAPAAAPEEGEAAASTQEEGAFTEVLCKKKRRQLRKAGRLNESVETPRAPDSEATARVTRGRLRAAAAEKEVLPQRRKSCQREEDQPSQDDEDEDEDQSQDEDEDEDEDRSRNLDHSAPLPEWRLVAFGDSFASCFQAIRWMESELELDFRVRVSPSGEYLVRASNWKNECALSDFANEKPEGIVIEKSETVVRGVVLGYPVHLPLDPITDHPEVIQAVRCLVNAGRGRRLPTRSVRVTLRGKLPSSLDLGCWGRFACRRFVPEPLRCFRCQAFGHHQQSCQRAKDLCGACGGEHSTRECLQRRRNGECEPVPLCVNCGARHYAWHRRCPARLSRIHGAAPRLGPRRAAWEDLAAAAAAVPGPRAVERGRRHTGERPSAQEATVTAAAPAQRTGYSEGGQRRSRHRRRRTRRKPLDERPWNCPAPPAQEPEEPPMRHQVSPDVSGVAATENQRIRRSNQSTQTEVCYVYSEGALADLLVQYEHLLAQENEARTRRIPHEPALHCARRHVREGRRIPIALPMAQPLKNRPRFRHHIGEKKWEEFSENDEEDEQVTEEDDSEVDEEIVVEQPEEIKIRFAVPGQDPEWERQVKESIRRSLTPKKKVKICTTLH